MATLARLGYQSVSGDDLLTFLRQERSLPKKSVLISFDDGYLDNYVYAHPILARYGLSATLFIVTGWIGQGAPRATLTSAAHAALPNCPNHAEASRLIAAGKNDEVVLRWSEIEAMRQAGTFEFHSHTHTHTRWDQSDYAQRLAHLGEELSQSRQTLQARLGLNSTHLCWPQGYYEPAYQQLAHSMGFAAQYTTQKRINAPGDDALSIGRIVVKERAGNWLPHRLSIYSHPLLGRIYTQLRGR